MEADIELADMGWSSVDGGLTGKQRAKVGLLIIEDFSKSYINDLNSPAVLVCKN
jgi:hypothetical protein